MVIGFLGGFGNHGARARGTVQVVEHIRNSHREGVYVCKGSANRERGQAYKEIRRRLDGGRGPELFQLKKSGMPRIVIFGRGWGAYLKPLHWHGNWNVTAFPSMLTIQVDSVAKLGQNDALIPANVGQAVNLRPHDHHGRPQIRAADPARTEIPQTFATTTRRSPFVAKVIPGSTTSW